MEKVGFILRHMFCGMFSFSYFTEVVRDAISLYYLLES